MSDMSTRDIVYITAEAIVGFVTVTGNTIVLIAIIRTRALHTITNVFIGNLAVADIAVGIFVAPCAALSFLGLPRDKYGCIFINCAILMFTNISILMLLTIAVERFIAIRFPFTYKQHATIKTAILFSLSIWVVGSILGLLPMFGWNKAPDELEVCAFTNIVSMEHMVYFQFFAITLTPLLIMFLIYLYIYFIVRQHTKQTKALENLFRDSQVSSRNRRRWDKDVQAAKMFALLFFLFALFWLPVNIMNSITLFCPSCENPYPLLLTAIVLSHANSSVNPILYANNNSQIKNAIKVMFSLKPSQENVSDSISQAPTSHPDKENRARANSELPRATFQERNSPSNRHVDENDERVESNGNGRVENSENSPTTKTTRVTFVSKPDVIGQIDEQRTQQYSSTNNLYKKFNKTHSFRDEIDNTILDRITPLEGMMANIYNSLDSETRDNIENSTSEDNNTQNINNLEGKSTKDHNGHLNGGLGMSCHSYTSHKLSNKDSGHINYAFVDDYICADEKIAVIKIQEPEKCVANIHSETYPLHSYPTPTSKEIPTPKLLRSNKVQSADVLSSCNSQDSVPNGVNDIQYSESTVSLHTQITPRRTPSTPVVDSSLPITNSVDTDCLNGPSASSLGKDSYSTTQNVFYIESEQDDDISVKHFEDTRDKRDGAKSYTFKTDGTDNIKNCTIDSTQL